MNNDSYKTVELPDWLLRYLNQMPASSCARLNFAADVVIAASSALLFAMFLYLVKRRRAGWMAVFAWIGIFIIVTGIANLTEVFPLRPILVIAKAGGALVCLATSARLLPMAPKISALRNPVEVQREIAQRRRTELELRQMHAQLEAIIDQRTSELATKNEEMEQFLNTVSHDLKNPIINCMGLVEIVRQDTQAGRTEQTAESLDRIERSMKRMRQLIEDLLNLSRIGRVSFELAAVDTQVIFRSIAEELATRLQEGGIELKIAADLPTVEADAHWLTEVFENLVANAIKYGCDNPNPQISVGAIQQNDEMQFFVRDNGKGIDPAQHLKIFEPFKRLRSDKEGSGMGLAIVDRIIKMHRGRVWVESKPGNGATFWVALPLAHPTQKASVRRELELVS